MNFEFILNPDILLYRSVKTRENLLGEWYSFIPEDTYGYGPITGEFRSTKSLKLIDITKNSFYNDFRDNIIKYSKINPIINSRKKAILFPLGFPDYKVYTKIADELGITRELSIDLNIELDAQYYGNRSRCSIMEFDLELVSLLKEIYPTYDGIISPIKLPNTLMNGYQFSEMCVFNRDNIKLVKEFSRIQTAGNMTPQEPIKMLGAISLDTQFTREYVSSMKEFHRTFKFLSNDNIIEKSISTNTPLTPGPETFKKTRKTRKNKLNK